MTTSASDVSSLVTSLQSSITAALASVKKQAEDATATGVTSDQQTVQKSSLNVKATATDVGTLIKNKTRLNVVSSLASADTVDFYKFTVSEKGDATLGRAGASGVRLQVMDKTGNVIADSDSSSGAAYDAYTKMTTDGYTLDKGEYTVRITRDKGESAMESKDYAFQLVMGQYSQDKDTIAKQPTTSSGSSYLSLLTGSSGSTASGLAAFLSGSSTGTDGLAAFLNGGSSSSSSSSTDISSLISNAKRGTLLNDLL